MAIQTADIAELETWEREELIAEIQRCWARLEDHERRIRLAVFTLTDGVNDDSGGASPPSE